MNEMVEIDTVNADTVCEGDNIKIGDLVLLVTETEDHGDEVTISGLDENDDEHSVTVPWSESVVIIGWL